VEVEPCTVVMVGVWEGRRCGAGAGGRVPFSSSSSVGV
jgi:hypothetical protein